MEDVIELLKTWELDNLIPEFTTSNEETTNIAAFLTIPLLLNTAAVRQKKKRGSGASRSWKPSKVEVREGFIKHVRSSAEITQTIELRVTTLQKIGLSAQPYIIVVVQYNNAHSNYHHVNYNNYNQNFGNANSLGILNGQQTAQSNHAHNPSYANTQAQRPVITKHIYFHLPPPDDGAAAAAVTAAPPKKTYNIIFIKLPSQKSASAARLQQVIHQQAAIENKTLIYVLVKKSETQSIQPITSKPEVFFVKYKDPRNVAQRVNTDVVQVPMLQRNTPGLLPGLVNGHGTK